MKNTTEDHWFNVSIVKNINADEVDYDQEEMNYKESFIDQIETDDYHLSLLEKKYRRNLKK